MQLHVVPGQSTGSSRNESAWVLHRPGSETGTTSDRVLAAISQHQRSFLRGMRKVLRVHPRQITGRIRVGTSGEGSFRRGIRAHQGRPGGPLYSPVAASFRTAKAVGPRDIEHRTLALGETPTLLAALPLKSALRRSTKHSTTNPPQPHAPDRSRTAPSNQPEAVARTRPVCWTGNPLACGPDMG